MKKPALFALLTLLSFALTAMPSEIAEVAKKEKARRAAVEKQGKPAKVFTNQDIVSLKSSLAFEVSEPQGEETEKTDITTLPAADRGPAETVSTSQQQQDQERNEEMKRLEEEREALEQQARDAQQTIDQGGGYHTRNIGTQYKLKREADARIREIDEKLEKEKEEDKQ